jgi:hypothetical protein
MHATHTGGGRGEGGLSRGRGTCAGGGWGAFCVCQLGISLEGIPLFVQCIVKVTTPATLSGVRIPFEIGGAQQSGRFCDLGDAGIAYRGGQVG